MKKVVLLLLCIFVITAYGAKIKEDYYKNGVKSSKEKN